jgi:hypothetical protein
VAEPRKRTGPVTTPAPPRTATTGKSSQFDASVTRLEDWKASRLAAPWPGWWGDAELKTWAWAERTRRPA